MASFDRTLLRVKQDLNRYLPPSSIIEPAIASGHCWRERLLDPVLTVQLFILQVLNFNTSLTQLKHLTAGHIKPSAFCQARARLPPGAGAVRRRDGNDDGDDSHVAAVADHSRAG